MWSLSSRLSQSHLYIHFAFFCCTKLFILWYIFYFLPWGPDILLLPYSQTHLTSLAFFFKKRRANGKRKLKWWRCEGLSYKQQNWNYAEPYENRYLPQDSDMNSNSYPACPICLSYYLKLENIPLKLTRNFDCMTALLLQHSMNALLLQHSMTTLLLQHSMIALLLQHSMTALSLQHSMTTLLL